MRPGSAGGGGGGGRRIGGGGGVVGSIDGPHEAHEAWFLVKFSDDKNGYQRTDGPTERPTEHGRTHPLIEMRGRI